MVEDDPSPKPSTESLNVFLLFTTRHACNVEYFLDKLDLGSKDLERPHDLVGPGNKFEYPVLMGLSLVYEERDPEVEYKYKDRITEAIEAHRQQYHHRMWNEPNIKSTEEDMLVGAVDTVCAMLEGRSFQRKIGDYDDVLRIARGESDIPCETHKRRWIEKIAPEMQKIKQPSLEEILAVRQFPNIGLPKPMYNLIRTRARETILQLEEHGYKIK